MNKLFLSLVGILAAGALAVGILALSRDVKTPVPEQPVGAVSGPDLSSPYFSVNGVTKEYRRIALNTATNTICAIKSPAATSTIDSYSVYLKTSTSSASLVEIAKALTPYATTTLLARQSFGASDINVALVATSTTLGTYTGIIGPNQYLVANMVGANVGTVSPTGTCQAVFTVIQ